MQITDQDIVRAAEAHAIDPALIAAIIDVEGGKGRMRDGRLLILYEPHIFDRLTDGAHSVTKPISAPSWSQVRRWGYGSYAEQYRRRTEAAKRDKDAAYQACSYGPFQLLGSNYREAGYDNVFALVDDLQDSDRAALKIIMHWIGARGLLKHLRDENLPAFARGYNGPGHEAHDYVGRLERARSANQSRFEGKTRPDADPDEAAAEARQVWDVTIARGQRGEAVRFLQERLGGLKVDGIFGGQTEQAVENFQRRRGLTVDGIVGPQTWAALLGDHDG